MAKKYLDFEGLSHFKGKLDVVLAAIDEKLVEMYYTKGEVDVLIDDLQFGIMKKVDALPAVGEEHIIYLVPKAAPATGFDEYLWLADEQDYELIGTTNIDLSDYYKKSEVDTLVNTEKTRAQGVEQTLQNEILGQTGAIQTAISNANTATAAANAAATAANNVNATLNTTTNVVTITDRTGTSKSIDLTNKTNVELEGSVITVTNKTGVEKEIDLLDATNERVYVNVTTNKEGQSVAGLVINCFLNNDVDEPLQATTNANGQCYFDVPNNYHYRLVFPTIAGCNPITDVTHIAHASQRIVDVEYKVPVPQPEVGEQLVLIVQKSVQRVHSKLEDVHVVITYDGALQTDYYTNENGEIGVVIPFGKEYTIEMPKLAGLHLASGRFHRHLVAEQSRRTYVITYDDYESGAFIITNTSKKYSLEDFEAARQLPVTDPDYVQNSDAKAIIIETDELENVEGRFGFTGVFGLDIDLVRTTNFNSTNWKKMWATDSKRFTSISADGSSITDKYYFDGLTASELIYDEQGELNVTAEAVNLCRARSITIGDTVHPGFLGSIGQWQALYLLIGDVDNILRSVRPEGYYPTGTQLFVMSSFNGVKKWTSAQNGGAYAYCFTSALIFDYKSMTRCAFLPFFAF